MGFGVLMANTIRDFMSYSLAEVDNYFGGM
jgi:hypothetical protein